jgi:hypothetical protein
MVKVIPAFFCFVIPAQAGISYRTLIDGTEPGLQGSLPGLQHAGLQDSRLRGNVRNCNNAALCYRNLILLVEYGPWIVAWCFFALTCGGFIKGALGVGTPLLTVPMMAQVLPPQMAIAIMAIPVVVANVLQFAQAERSTAVVARFWPTFIAILIGTWIGVKILSTIDEKTLMFLVGVAVIAFALLQGSKFRLHLPDRLVKPAGILFGGASGLIGGVSSFFGPMLITYLISIRGLSKNQFVSSISFLYVSAVVPWTLTLYYFGLLDERLLVYSTFATLPVTLGLLTGQRIRHWISEERFRYLIIGILVISGLSMLWRAAQ